MTGISKESGELYTRLCAALTVAERKRIIAGVDDVSVLERTQALVEQFAIDAEKGEDFKGARFYGSISRQLVRRMEELKPKEVHMSRAEQEKSLADMGFQLEDGNNSWWRRVVIFYDVSVNVGVFLSASPESRMEIGICVSGMGELDTWLEDTDDLDMPFDGDPREGVRRAHERILHEIDNIRRILDIGFRADHNRRKDDDDVG